MESKRDNSDEEPCGFSSLPFELCLLIWALKDDVISSCVLNVSTLAQLRPTSYQLKPVARQPQEPFSHSTFVVDRELYDFIGITVEYARERDELDEGIDRRLPRHRRSAMLTKKDVLYFSEPIPVLEPSRVVASTRPNLVGAELRDLPCANVAVEWHVEMEPGLTRLERRVDLTKWRFLKDIPGLNSLFVVVLRPMHVTTEQDSDDWHEPDRRPVMYDLYDKDRISFLLALCDHNQGFDNAIVTARGLWDNTGKQAALELATSIFGVDNLPEVFNPVLMFTFESRVATYYNLDHNLCGL